VDLGIDFNLYLWIKWLHMSCAVISICGFTVRGLLKLQYSNYLQQRWIKIVPHINDTLLLGCAIYLALQIEQYPLVNSWLTAKLCGLLAYILLGMVVMRFGRTQQQRLIAFVLALLSFAYIVAVALTHSPTAGF
jgi:uncharacterized membrane protein SirB2